MQKYQNFLIKSARQCWPGDASDVGTKIPQRSNDLLADHWLYDIIKGGLAFTGLTGASFQFSATSDFDTTFTDTSGLQAGLYRQITDDFIFDKVPVKYANGLTSNSKCHQERFYLFYYSTGLGNILKTIIEKFSTHIIMNLFLMYHSAKSELSAVTVITIVTSTGNQFQKLTGQMLMFGSMANLLFQILHFQQILIFYP